MPVSEAELAKLQPIVGRTAQVTTATGSYAATVDRAAAELDERTRFATIYLQFDQTEVPAPGTFVDVSVSGPTVADTFLLPFAAEQSNGRVWVADAGALRAVTPTIIARTNDGLIVNAFDAGDGVVLGAMPTARNGLSVRLAAAGS